MTAPDQQWSTGTVALDGAQVDYDWRDGRSPPVLFVPGWCCPRTDWYAVAEHLPGQLTATVDLPAREPPAPAARRSTCPLTAEPSRP